MLCHYHCRQIWEVLELIKYPELNCFKMLSSSKKAQHLTIFLTEGYILLQHF